MSVFEIFVGVFAAELLLFIIANSLFDDDEPDGWS